MVTCRAATGDDFETFFAQALADAGTDATHTTRDVSYFLTHCVFLFVNYEILRPIRTDHLTKNGNESVFN
jgi:hypothetical protein